MAKLTLSDIVTFVSDVAAKLTYKQNNDLIEAALENTLSRDGTTPNTMTANLDMNSKKVINLANATAGGDAVSKTFADANYKTGTTGATGATGAQGPAGSGSGDVIGPGSSTDNAVVRYNLATGTSVQDSGVLVDDSNNVSGVGNLTLSGNVVVSGTVDGRDIATDGTKLNTIATSADVNVNKNFSVIHTSNTALDTRAGGGTQIGSTISSATVPTTGVIRVTLLEAEFDETENTADAEVAIALDVGGTKVWVSSDKDDGTSSDFTIAVSQNTSSRLFSRGRNEKGPDSLMFSFDIVAHSFPTGTRDIKIYLGDNAESTTGEITVTGGTVPCRFLVEVITTV